MVVAQDVPLVLEAKAGFTPDHGIRTIWLKDQLKDIGRFPNISCMS